MLSTHSFNALLKTLEEPPPHVKFLLATTDPQKLPVTVLSRCLQFHLRRLPLAQIQERLTMIAQAEKVEFEPAALRAIARGAEGSMRERTVAARPGAGLRRWPGHRERGAHTARDARSAARRGNPERARRAGRRGADGLRGAARRARPGLRPGPRGALGRNPAHGVAAGVARAAWRGRGAGRGARPARREVPTPKTCNCSIRSRSWPVATSTTRPDARGGFEMALLRMLAFQPESLSGTAPSGPPPAARTAPATPRVAAQAEVPRHRRLAIDRRCARPAGPGRAARGALRAGRPPRASPSSCGSIPPAKCSAGPQLEQKLAQALAQHFGQPVRLDIAGQRGPRKSRPPGSRRERPTPALKAAEQAIEADSNVRAMREVFGATVQPGSVKPLN